MKIMVGYDRSKVAKDALELAKKHAKAFDAKVHVLTSLEQSNDLQIEDIQRAEHELEYETASLKEDNISCETQAIVSLLSPGEDLIQFAEENEIDEIVIGVRRRSKVGKLIFGSTAQFVILNAPCPVVSVT
jgi:nucleotide-binding universal stress UspA family protein